MGGRGIAEGVVVLVLVVVVGSLLLGNLLGQPILLSYVETESMEPTLEPGDGFVAIPAPLAGPIESGDVITFRAETLNDGGLTTHRVVEKTDEGYVTKGDNNPFTDQDGSEPPVQEAQVVAEALQVGGGVLAIPYLGFAVETLQGILGVFTGSVSAIQRQLAIATGNRAFLGQQGLAYLLFGVGILAYVASLLFETEEVRTRESTGRDEGFNASLVVLGLALLMVVSMTTSMALPSGGHSFDMVSAENDAPGPSVVQQGTTEEVGYSITNGGIVPMVVFLESGGSGIDVEPKELAIGGGETANATVQLTAPDQLGYYPRYMTERWYLGILPRGTIRGLYGIHPWLPVIVIDVAVGIASAAIGFAVLGTGRVRFRSREVGLADRVKRWF